MTDTAVIFSILARDQASPVLGKIGGAAQSLISGLAAFAAVDFFKGALAEADEARVTLAQTQAVIASTGGAANITSDQVSDLATKLSNLAGVDDELIQHGENVLLTFTNVKNGVGQGNDIFDQATLAALNMSRALGTDMQGAAIQVGKALNDPVRGVTALQRVGVSFTASQKEQIATLIESGQTMDAQKLILAELTKEFGGAAAAAATPADKARVAWGNFKETLGTKLMPAVSPVLEKLTGVLGWIGDHSWAVTALSVAFGLLATALIISTAATWAQNLAFLANPITLVVLAVAALAAGIIYLATKTQFFQTVWDTVWGGIKTGFKATVNFLIDHLNHVVDGLNSISHGINVVNPFSDIPNIPHVPRLAAGADITRAGQVMVGDAGPEILTLPAGARVTPLDQAGGGQPVMITLRLAGSLRDLIRADVDSGGGNVQVVYGR